MTRAQTSTTAEAILGAVAFAAEQLLRADHPHDALPAVLARIGPATAADRALVTRVRDLDRAPTLSVVAEWHAADLSPLVGTRIEVGAPLEAVTPPGWSEALRAGEPVSGVVPAHALADAAGLASIPLPEQLNVVAVPLERDGAWWGALVLTAADPTHTWTEAQLEALRAAAQTFSAALERHERGAALHASETRFRRLAENAHDLVFRYRLKPDRAFEYMSPAATTILGYTPEEHYADPDLVRTIIHPADFAVLSDPRVSLAGPSIVRWYHRDGRLVWTEQRTSGVYDEHGDLVGLEGILRDITARIVAERALRQRAREQEAVAELSSFALGRQPLEAVMERAAHLAADVLALSFSAVLVCEPDGRLQVVAAEGWDTAGGQALADPGGHVDEAVRRDEPIVVSADDVSRVPVLARHGLRSGVAVPVTGAEGVYGALTAHSTEAERFDADDVAFCQALANVLAAAVVRVHAEEAVAGREREFRLLAENSPDIIARYDRALRHRYVNPVVEQKMGVAPDQLIGRTHRELGMPAELVAHVEEVVTRVFERGEPETSQHSYPAPDGQPLRFEARYIPETSTDGSVEFVLCVSRDVTQRYEDEQQLLHAVERLRRIDEERRRVLDRLVCAQEQERTRIAADIHDDSIQVMVAAALRLETLAPHIATEEGAEILEKLSHTVQRAVTRLRRLIFELRPPQLDRDGLAPTIRTALEMSWDDGGTTWSVHDQLDHDPDPQLRAILYRIAQEAIANVRRHADATYVSVLLEDAQPGYRMRIQDNGKGFVQGEPDEPARGHMGITSMRERAELAGGWLQLHTGPGKGTTVEVWVPASAPHTVGERLP